MAHRFNLNLVVANLFQVRNFVYASKSFCENHQIIQDDYSDKQHSFGNYSGALQSEVDTSLIDVAIRMRMFLDVLKAFDQSDFNLGEHISAAEKGLQFGEVIEGKFRLSLRECYNKLIHADQIGYNWTDNDDFTWWDGTIWLRGTRGKAKWLLNLDVENFSVATERLVGELEENVDWGHFLKYGY